MPENNTKNEKEESPKYETLDELITLLIEVRVDLTFLCKSVNSEHVKEELKWAINGIDIVGCGLCQNTERKNKIGLIISHWLYSAYKIIFLTQDLKKMGRSSINIKFSDTSLICALGKFCLITNALIVSQLFLSNILK